jgi:hypothetical protein
MKPTAPHRKKFSVLPRGLRVADTFSAPEPGAIQVQLSVIINNQVRKQLQRRLSHICGICFLLTFISQHAAGDEPRNSNRDRAALLALENGWLKNEHNATKLEHILASDFLHPVVTGDVLNKAQHIEFSSKHLPPADLTNHFEGLQVRIYGDVGIVNGLVVTTNREGNTVNKTVFTDVFVYRDGRWQAVNAQENAVKNVDKAQ